MPYYDDELPEEYAEMGAVMYWKDRAKKAEKWSKAWKRTAKEYRGFYQIMAEKAGEWQGKCFKAERETSALRSRVAELERLLAMAEEAAQDLAQSKSAGAGAWGSHTVSKFKKDTDDKNTPE